MSTNDAATRTGHALIQVLGRIEAALGQRHRCCTVCGCLCRPGESCPNCAINHAGRAS